MPTAHEDGGSSGNPRGMELPPETIWKSAVVATYSYCYSTLYCVCCSGDHSTLPWGKWISEQGGGKEDSVHEKGLIPILHLRCRKVSGKRSAEQNHKRFKRQKTKLSSSTIEYKLSDGKQMSSQFISNDLKR